MSFFNEEQQSWMRYLGTLPPEAKCDCGWNRRGECFGSCYGKPERGGALTPEQRAEKIKAEGGVLCPGCNGEGSIRESLGAGLSISTCGACKGSGRANP